MKRQRAIRLSSPFLTTPCNHPLAISNISNDRLLATLPVLIGSPLSIPYFVFSRFTSMSVHHPQGCASRVKVVRNILQGCWSSSGFPEWANLRWDFEEWNELWTHWFSSVLLLFEVFHFEYSCVLIASSALKVLMTWFTSMSIKIKNFKHLKKLFFPRVLNIDVLSWHTGQPFCLFEEVFLQ